MKKISISFLSMLSLLSCSAPSTEEKIPENEPAADTYDSALSVQLGADQYGMKQYVMALLKKGENRNHDSVTQCKYKSNTSKT